MLIFYYQVLNDRFMIVLSLSDLNSWFLRNYFMFIGLVIYSFWSLKYFVLRELNLNLTIATRIFIKEYSKIIIPSLLIILWYFIYSQNDQVLILDYSTLEPLYLQQLLNWFQYTYFNVNKSCYCLFLQIDYLQSLSKF